MLISRELQEDTSLAIALCKGDVDCSDEKSCAKSIAEKAQSIYGASAELKIMKHEVSGDSPYPYGDVSDLTIYTSETREAAKKREEFVASIVVGSRVVASHGGETEYIAVFLLDNLLDDEKEARRQGKLIRSYLSSSC